MNCDQCKVDKLYREYPQVPLTRDCQHPPLTCMRCTLAAVSQSMKCPDCQTPVSPDAPSVQDIERRLKFMFSVHSAPVANFTDQGKLRIATLTGEYFTVPYQEQMTVLRLKRVIQVETGQQDTNQTLLFSGTDLKIRRPNGALASLEDYGITEGQTIHLITLMYAIPDDFDHVTFDLSWGYPASGIDALDASCLAFSGSSLLFIADYRNKKPEQASCSVWHSGDRMDDERKVGHHCIEVKLKKLPQNVTHLFFSLSAWKAPSIASYPNPTLNFYEASNNEDNLCSTTLQHVLDSRAVIMCFATKAEGLWQIFESGKRSDGYAEDYGPLVETIQGIINEGI